MKDFHAIDRFNNRINYYSKFRPDYPESVFSFLELQLGLKKEMTFADIGSGTGLFSEHFLRKGYKVICIEPNDEMRDYAEKHLSVYPTFISKKATGEDTGLNDKSVDCIFVAQAFHWLNPEASKLEFERIIKSNGKIVICWILATQTSLFLKKYEELRQTFAVDYKPVKRNNEDILSRFYAPANFSKKIFHFSNFLDFNSLKGLLLSVSFMPQPGHPAYPKMMDTLSGLFERFNKNGHIEIEYDLPVYWNS